MDELAGSAAGLVNLNFQMPEGNIAHESGNMAFSTRFEDGSNMKLQCFGPRGMNVRKEDGWYSTSYRKRRRRMKISFNAWKKKESAVRYITIIRPIGKSADVSRFQAEFGNGEFDEKGVGVEITKKNGFRNMN